MEKAYLAVNEFAPRDGKLCVYFKKTKPCKKSDGFAAILDGEVYLIDVGGRKDEEMLRFLTSLWEAWLKNAPNTVEKDAARLEVNVIISHSHPDHLGGIHFILDDPRFTVKSFFAPCRSVASVISPDAIPTLTEEEDKLDGWVRRLQEEGLSPESIVRIPYGCTRVIPFHGEDARLTVYATPFDWSEDRPSESEGIRFLKKYTSPTYISCPEKGWANGVLNGNSLWVKIVKGDQAVLITGDQRDSDEMLGAMIRFYGMEAFRCDVMKLCHHGEKNFAPHFIEQSGAKIFIFTVSREIMTPETAELCGKIGKWYSLGDGNLVLTLDGAGGITETVYE